MKDDTSKTGDDALDLDAWTPQLPPSDFAARVIDRIQAEAPAAPATAKARRARRLWAPLSAGVAALAVAAALLIVLRPPQSGEAIAKERVEVPIGSRALAVLEPGATVRWSGDDVVQSRGDVFYRVEPGTRFTVHTPAGDVEVKGTCFTVKVRPIGQNAEDGAMQKRDMKAGAIGAALTALAFVTVYEGKVLASHAEERVDLRPGDSARLGPDGVKRAAAEEGKDLDRAAEALEAGDPQTRANQNLVRQVGEYRSRLEAITQQKADLEAKLKRSEADLSHSRDGAPAGKHEFDVTSDEWKELAKDGTIKYQLPCIDPKGAGWSPTAEKLNTLGLAPQDGPAIQGAYARSSQRLWGEIKELCAGAVGSAEIAGRIGPGTCIHLILDTEAHRDPRGTDAARKLVGEIRAGTRPMPGANEPLPPIARLFLATTGASKALENDLAQSFGPEEAHRLVYSDELCMGHSSFGAAPRGSPKP